MVHRMWPVMNMRADCPKPGVSQPVSHESERWSGSALALRLLLRPQAPRHVSLPECPLMSSHCTSDRKQSLLFLSLKKKQAINRMRKSSPAFVTENLLTLFHWNITLSIQLHLLSMHWILTHGTRPSHYHPDQKYNIPSTQESLSLLFSSYHAPVIVF